MSKTEQRAIKSADALARNEILENESRKSQKHRKRFSEFLEEDEEYQNFSLFGKDDKDVLDDETIKKYLK